ncbi:unnamed protein product [Timema podura]|uniref:Uncharacterized protein n=1 Tax=Timema podura TaxID=61482 RepID=A0ABN7P3J3_TIMPD|nr:unnamed protein product [Timema podura]
MNKLSIVATLCAILASLVAADDMEEMSRMLHNSCRDEIGIEEDVISACRKGEFPDDPKLKGGATRRQIGHCMLLEEGKCRKLIQPLRQTNICIPTTTSRHTRWWQRSASIFTTSSRPTTMSLKESAIVKANNYVFGSQPLSRPTTMSFKESAIVETNNHVFERVSTCQGQQPCL